MRIAGIDPGLSGGITSFVLNGNHGRKFVACDKMPTLPAGDSKKVLNEPEIKLLLEKADHVYIEKVHSMPKQGVASSFTFGTGFGIIRGICVGLDIPYTLVEPKTWQKEMFTGVNRKNTKKASVIIAHRLFPEHIEYIGQHDGKSDSLLIAEFARRRLL